MAQLFAVDKSGISRHITNIFKEGELQQATTVAKIATVVNRGVPSCVNEFLTFRRYRILPDKGWISSDV